jgi:hypothetical protein
VGGGVGGGGGVAVFYTGGAGGGRLGGLVRPRRALPPARAPATATEPALSPLPTLRLEDGRLQIGPFKVPNVKLPPLY